jgi:hypothetical protein
MYRLLKPIHSTKADQWYELGTPGLIAFYDGTRRLAALMNLAAAAAISSCWPILPSGRLADGSFGHSRGF